MSPDAWVQSALCAGLPPDMFFPERGESVAEAKAVCARCSVATECLAYAVDTGQKHGIWGGQSERQRRRLRASARGTAERPEEPSPAEEAQLSTDSDPFELIPYKPRSVGALIDTGFAAARTHIQASTPASSTMCELCPSSTRQQIIAAAARSGLTASELAHLATPEVKSR